MSDSTQNRSKEEIIAERQSNLPMPDAPPVESDFNTSDGSAMNVGSGGISTDGTESSSGLRNPASGDSAVRDQKENEAGLNVGRVPGGTASDAAGDRKTGTTETRNADYGYPEKSDPAGADVTRGHKETTLSKDSVGPGAS